MNMIIRSVTLGLALLLWCNRTGAQTTMTDDEIRKLLRDQVEHLQSPGIVVGLIDAHGPKVLACGKTAREGGIDVDGDTIFEIGSATKVFTGLLLTEMAQQGEVKLDDPIGKYLPPGVKSPERKGREITLLDLALHRSGLPRLPDNFASKDPEAPYADYTFENVCAFLSGYALTRDIGALYEYSNLGAGLLGCLLARHAGTNYETLVIGRICRPLGMTSTAIKLSPELKRRFATGHDAALQPVKSWDFDALAGCGAIRSTANDLLKFLAANMGLTSGHLWPAMKRMQEPLGTTDVPNTQIGIAWHITDRDGRRIIWHNGQTAGFHSCVAFDPTNKAGVVLLANAAASLDPLAFRLITPNAGASNSAPHSDDTVLRLETAQLKRFVGK